MLGNALNQPTKFKTKNWIEINDESYGVYNIGIQIKFQTSMLRSNLSDYSDAYIFAKGTITVANTRTAAVPNNRNTKLIFKNCAPFTDCISETNNIEIDYGKDIGVVMSLYYLIESSDNYSKTSGSLWQYYRYKPPIKNNWVIIDVPDNPDNSSLKSKQKIKGQMMEEKMCK